MKHEEYEKQMLDRVNRNCQMKELDRQEIERAAEEEYRFVRKCKKANAIIGIIVWFACFTAITFAVGALTWLGEIPAVYAVAATAVVGMVSGLNINDLANRTKN